MHECTGVGGALKNIGMGCGSRAGKMEMHSNGKPTVDHNLCIGCGVCAKACAHDAISFDSKKKATIDKSKCAGCGRCIGRCPKDAVHAAMDENFEILNKKICEYSLAVMQNRQAFHISLVTDVSPFAIAIRKTISLLFLMLECSPQRILWLLIWRVQKRLMPNLSCLIAFFASKKSRGDHFQTMHPGTNWRSVVEYGAEIGLGSLEYDLIEI